MKNKTAHTFSIEMKRYRGQERRRRSYQSLYINNHHLDLEYRRHTKYRALTYCARNRHTGAEDAATRLPHRTELRACPSVSLSLIFLIFLRQKYLACIRPAESATRSWRPNISSFQIPTTTAIHNPQSTVQLLSSPPVRPPPVLCRCGYPVSIVLVPLRSLPVNPRVVMFRPVIPRLAAGRTVTRPFPQSQISPASAPLSGTYILRYSRRGYATSSGEETSISVVNCAPAVHGNQPLTSPSSWPSQLQTNMMWL